MKQATHWAACSDLKVETNQVGVVGSGRCEAFGDRVRKTC